ncbi:MAG: cell division protein FtsX [Alphaproteobacteria bacterium]
MRLKRSADIPFARDDAHRLLPWMIACLVGLSALLLLLAFSLSGRMQQQARDVFGTVQVELPSGTPASKREEVMAAIRSTPGAVDVAWLTPAQMEVLLRPWLGDHLTLKGLSLPVLIDVKTEVKGNRSAIDIPQLKNKLAPILKNVRIEDRGPWLTHMAEALRYVQGLVLLIAASLLACVVALVVLVARASLKLHFKTVHLLHMFGATDEYILRQFQQNSARLAVRGALYGVGFALIISAAAVMISQQWQSPILPAITVLPVHLVTLLLLPVFTALIALLATRLTVQSMLAQMH